MKMSGMTIEQYQDLAYRAVQQHADEKEEILHWVIGLTEEAGEVASLIKHKYFHGEQIGNEKIAEELGDVLWYLSALCTVFEIPLSSVAEANVLKLATRFENGKYSDEAVSNRHNKDAEISTMVKTII